MNVDVASNQIKIGSFESLTDAITDTAIRAETLGITVVSAEFDPTIISAITGFVDVVAEEDRGVTLPNHNDLLYMYESGWHSGRAFRKAMQLYPELAQSLRTGISNSAPYIEARNPSKLIPRLGANAEPPRMRSFSEHMDDSHHVSVVVEPHPFQLRAALSLEECRDTEVDTHTFGPALIGIRGPGSVLERRRLGIVHAFGNKENTWRYSIATDLSYRIVM